MKYTKETLQNTWGIVESKEHAEFIVELAELHGAKLIKGYSEGRYFNFYREEGRLSLAFWDKVSSCTSLGEKQITIPLPPKPNYPEIQDSSEQANCRSAFVDLETWPQVDDKVTVYGQQGDVILPADKNGFYIINADGLYLAAKAKDITKPKSKEDLLIEELQTKLCENNHVDNYTLANDIVNGMIEGLVYEPK